MIFQYRYVRSLVLDLERDVRGPFFAFERDLCGLIAGWRGRSPRPAVKELER